MSKENIAMGRFPATGEVVFVRNLRASLDQVWAYLTESDKRSKWLAAGVMELRLGGRVALRFRHADLSGLDDAPPEKYRQMAEQGCAILGEITHCEPPRLLGFTWSEDAGRGPASEVTFELEQAGEAVRLTLRHRRLGDDPEVLTSVGAGWHTHLAILAARLVAEPAPLFWATHTKWEAEYREQTTFRTGVRGSEEARKSV